MSTKLRKYSRLYSQLADLLIKSPVCDSQLATINAVLYHKIEYIFWVGFYIKRAETLIVGPYQGPLACQTLSYPNGACWNAAINKIALLIPDVSKFSGHISCDPRSKSEIVIPIYTKDKEVFGVLDVDCNKLNIFDKDDVEGLTQIAGLINVT
jgi:L-methionine (R)-S-oxide reductase